MKKRPSEEPILVYVSTSAMLRDFIISTRGSDLIIADDKSPLWVVVKTHLKSIPNDYKPHRMGPEPGYVRVVLPPISASSPIFSLAAGAKIICNFLYRNYLDDKGQKAVADHLNKTFKEQYRSFMAGYLAMHANQQEASQIKEGIDEFCRIHRIALDDKIAYETLRKDWYRWRTRESSSDFCEDVKLNL